MTLRTSTLDAEGVYQASKYLKYQVLCNQEELARLFAQLTPFFLYPLTGLSDGEAIEHARFLSEYGCWIEALRQGRPPTDAELRQLLACALTDDLDTLWKQKVPQNRYIIKMAKPVVQIQAHFFTYSPIDGVFRPMTMGFESIFWGLQFSFPQIYQDPKTLEFLEIKPSRLFQTIKHWVREETRATPFIVDGKKINVPIRLGKECFSWIQHHPQLLKVRPHVG